MHYVRQGDPRGLGHAVLCAAQHVGDEPFAVLLGDDLIDPRDPLLQTMLDVQPAVRRQRRRADGGADGADRTCTAAPPSTPTGTTGRRRRASPTWSRSRRSRRRRATSRSSAATCSTPASSTCCGRPTAGPRRRDPAHRRAAAAGGRPASDGPVHGVVFRGRRYDTGDRLRLPQGRRAARVRARRPRAGLPRLAARRSWGQRARPVTDLEDRRRAPRGHPRRRRAAGAAGPPAARRARLHPRRGRRRAEVDLPPFDNSAMDGYAVRVADVASASEATPVQLPVVGDIAAGTQATYARAARPVRADHDRRADAGRRRRRRTGGVDRRRGRAGGDHARRPSVGAHIRRRGEDVAAGDVVLDAGTRLGAGPDRPARRRRPRPRRGAAAAAGRRHLDRQRAGRAGQPHRRGPDPRLATATSLTAAAREAGAIAYRVGIVARRRAHADGHDRGPADPRRPGAHQRWRQRRCLRRREGGALPAGHGGLRRGGDAAGQAAGLRHHRPGPDADLHAARQPGVVVRLLRGVRPAGDPADARRRAAAPADGARGLRRRRSPRPPGKRQFVRGWLDVVDGRLRRAAGRRARARTWSAAWRTPTRWSSCPRRSPTVRGRATPSTVMVLERRAVDERGRSRG